MMTENIWSGQVREARYLYEKAKAEAEDAQEYADWRKANLDRLEEEEANG